MVKWAALLLFTGAVLAATGVASLSWWTRHEIYADTVAGYCLQPADLEGFHKGRLDPQATLATLLVQRAQSESPGQLSRLAQFEIRVLRKTGFFFVTRDEQLGYFDRLPICPSSAPVG